MMPALRVAAGAALEQGFALGLHQVQRTCAAENAGPTATAERLGLERVEAYHQAVPNLDEVQRVAWFRRQGG